MRVPAKHRWGALAALALIAGVPAAEAHRPPPGAALEYKADRAGYAVQVQVVPKEPAVGEKAELIASLWELGSGLPYRGFVTFLVAPAGGELGALRIPMEFGLGQFECTHVFREPGVHALSVIFDAQGREQRVGSIAVTVRPPSRVADGVAMGAALLAAVTYVAAFRHSRRKVPPGSSRG